MKPPLEADYLAALAGALSGAVDRGGGVALVIFRAGKRGIAAGCRR